MGSAWELGAVALLAFGCSTTATITRRNGTELEGFIQGGTPESVIVESEQGKLEEVRRDEITEVDHPGNVHALIGGLVFVYGGVVILEQMDLCKEQGRATAECVGSFVPAVVGASLFAWGIATWANSKSAAGESSMKPLPPRYGRPPPRGTEPAPGDELPPPPPAPPGYVGPAPNAPASAPTGPAAAPTAPSAPAPPPSSPPPAPPTEPDAGSVVW